MGQGEAGQEDQAGDGARGCHVGDCHQQERHHDGRQPGCARRGSGARRQGRVPPRKRSVGTHGAGEAGGGQQVGLQRREHGEEAGRQDQPIAGWAKEVAGCRGHQDLGVFARERRHRASGRAHGHDQKEERQIDRQGCAQRQEHGPGNVASAPLDLPADRRDQVEPLQGDESVAHRLGESRSSLGEEGSEAIGQRAGRRRLGRQHPEPRQQEDAERHDLAPRLPLASTGSRPGQPPSVEAGCGKGVADQRQTPAKPLRRRDSQRPKRLLQERHEKDGEPHGVEHRRHHRREPDDPPHAERRLYRQHPASVRVRPARMRKPRRKLGKGEHRQERDAPVERERQDRARPRGRKGDARQRQYPAADDGAHADPGRAEKAEVGGLGGGRGHGCNLAAKGRRSAVLAGASRRNWPECHGPAIMLAISRLAETLPTTDSVDRHEIMSLRTPQEPAWKSGR